MVMPGQSRPASLTQHQVDELSRGGSGEGMVALRAARKAPTGKARPPKGSAPVPLSGEEIEAITHNGTAPSNVVQRIVAAARTVKKPARGAAKAKQPRPLKGNAPSLRPPGASKAK